MTLTTIIDRIAALDEELAFAVEFWDGRRVRRGRGPEAVVVRLRDRKTALGLLANPSLRFGEAYMAGAIDVEGDLERLVRALLRLPAVALAPRGLHRLRTAFTAWGRRNSRRQAVRNIAGHYDLDNTFFRLWLGDTMAYSCAYFRSPTDDIDTAQTQKFHHIAEKLRLEKGRRLLDIGCGWGGFAAYAATTYGVNVLGITLSEAQRRFAEAMVRSRHLEERVEIRRQDYRDVDVGGGFEHVVSVGMLEHVGRERLPDYFRRTARLLADGGVGVVHTIGRTAPAPTDPWLTTYIFPGAYFPALAELATALGNAGLAITDVEALGPHYALTLDRWSDAFERNAETVRTARGEAFVRMWRFYLRASAAAFRSGNLTLWQIQFVKGAPGRLPLTREYLYHSL